jgi:DNA primase catalytic subunit
MTLRVLRNKALQRSRMMSLGSKERREEMDFLRIVRKLNRRST